MKVFLTPPSSLNSLALVSSGKFTCCFSCCHGNFSILHVPPMCPCRVAALYTDLGTCYKAMGLRTTKNLGLRLLFFLCYLYCSPKCFPLSHYSVPCILQNWCCVWLFAFPFSSLAFCSQVLPQYSNAAFHPCGITDTDSLICSIIPLLCINLLYLSSSLLSSVWSFLIVSKFWTFTLLSPTLRESSSLLF